MAKSAPLSVSELLLTRRGIVFVASLHTSGQQEEYVRAVEIELAELGYVLSDRLHERLQNCSLSELGAVRSSTYAVLRAHIGADQTHEPLFSNFPHNIPDNTGELWWKKVLVHFLQANEQPCLFCRRTGTTHVLNPCRHVVCDYCFDGSNYSACPVCEHHVDRSSPFFKAALECAVPLEIVNFKLLDLGTNKDDEARFLFLNLCERKQAISPDDRDALLILIREYKTQVLSWLPEVIPVRENVAVVFGTLFQSCEPSVVLPCAIRYMKTATDVLRFLAVLSGTDGSLLPETVFKTIQRGEESSRFWGKIAELLGAKPPGRTQRAAIVPMQVYRFRMARISRPLRRALFALLEGMNPQSLTEDMLRHRSYWVWMGEFLHPHEYSTRYPNVARAFQVVRKKCPDGAPAPAFSGWNSKLERTIVARDIDAMLAVLSERPGELARRIDHALRLAPDEAARARVLATFITKIPAFATPVLMTLRSHLATRDHRANVRVYWPKGRVAMGASSTDHRDVLPNTVTCPAVSAIEAELLRRFAAKPAFENCVIDEGLRTIVAPFNERTASRSAVSLPRGSRITIPTGKLIRLFLHWCEPAKGGDSSDLDLSVAFYDTEWNYVGVCSYYQLKMMGAANTTISQSAGDLRDAPWPDGATEFVDVHFDQARSAGIRYAVMVINNYAGMPFSQLERGFAGIMLRDDAGGQHFDPRTVDLKFAIDGQNGVFLPLVLDLQRLELHWLDVQAKGQFDLNNVDTSKAAIRKLCPELMAYFGSGVRASMYDLALLHAAARCRHVRLRGATIAEFVRRSTEDAIAFHARLIRGEADDSRSQVPDINGAPLLAMLLRGDLDLPVGSSAYALFRERVTPSLAASDLIT